MLEKVAITKVKLLLQMNCSTDPVSCHICGKCGCLMDEETANIVDNLPDLKKNIPEYVLMPLMYVGGYVVKMIKQSMILILYVPKFGLYFQEINRGDLQIPGNSICQWVICYYVTFLQSASVMYHSSFSNLAMIISDTYNFNIGRYHARVVANIFFNNSCKLYSPCLSQLLKLSC